MFLDQNHPVCLGEAKPSGSSLVPVQGRDAVKDAGLTAGTSAPSCASLSVGTCAAELPGICDMNLVSYTLGDGILPRIRPQQHAQRAQRTGILGPLFTRSLRVGFSLKM